MTEDVHVQLDFGDFLLLRLQADNLAQALAPQRSLRVELPRLQGAGIRLEEAVEVSEALKATLAGVSAAARRLEGHSMGIDLASKPVHMQLTGRFLGMLPETGQVFVQITPQGKGTADVD